MLDVLGPRGDPAADRLLERMAADDLIRGVLLLHGLHPTGPAHARRGRARVGAPVHAIARRWRRTARTSRATSCGSGSKGTARGAHRRRSRSSSRSRRRSTRPHPTSQAIEVVEPRDAQPAGPPQISGLRDAADGRVARSAPRRPRPSVAVSGDWVTLAARATHIDDGSVLKTTADGDSVLIARTGDVFYAYVATCPACARGDGGARRSTAPCSCVTCAALGTTSAAPAPASVRTSASNRCRFSRIRGCCASRSQRGWHEHRGSCSRVARAHPRARARGAVRALQRRAVAASATTSTSSSRRRDRSTAAARRARSSFPPEAEKRYRRVSRRLLYLQDFAMDDMQWESLAIPVNMAFLHTSTQPRRCARVLSQPGGCHRIDADASRDGASWWLTIRSCATLEPDVEALLINRVERCARSLHRADRPLLRARRAHPHQLARAERRHRRCGSGSTPSSPTCAPPRA